MAHGGAAVLFLWGALTSQDPGLDPRPYEPFFRRFCADCHLEGTAKGGLDLAQVPTDLRDAEALRRWVRIYDRVRLGEMPPPKKEQAPAGERDGFLKALGSSLTRADLARRKVVLRRLNRSEYENTVRDLFGVHADVRDLLPEDASLHGFDSMGEALAASAELIQAYLQAADVALDAAYGPEKEPKKVSLKFPLAQDCKAHIGDLFRDTPDGVALFGGYCPSAARSFSCKEEGTYRVRIHEKGFQSERPVVMSVHAGYVIVNRRPFHLVGHYDLPTDRMSLIEFTDRFARGDTFLPKPFGVAGAGKKDYPGPGIVVGEIEVEGPLEPWPPPSRALVLGGADPLKGTLEDARRVLLPLLPRVPAVRAAGRRRAVLALVKAELDAGRSYRDALRSGSRALTSPQFPSFRKEPVAVGAWTTSRSRSGSPISCGGSMPDAASSGRGGATPDAGRAAGPADRLA